MALAEYAKEKPYTFLLQISRSHKPLAKQPFASCLAGGSIAAIGIKEMPIVRNLVPIGRRLRRQFPWKRGSAGWSARTGKQQWRPGLRARARTGRSGSRIGRKVIQCLALGIGQDRFRLAAYHRSCCLDEDIRAAGGRCSRCWSAAAAPGTR